jgi:hypothetical protein
MRTAKAAAQAALLLANALRSAAALVVVRLTLRQRGNHELAFGVRARWQAIR